MSEKRLSMAEVLKRKREQKLKNQNISQTIEDMISKSENVIHELNVKELYPNPYQPRIEMDKEELTELVKSIRKNGLMSPIIVTEIEGKKIIVAGHRRAEAFKILGKDKIPAILKKDIDNGLLALLAITENTHRSNLNPIELAISYKGLLESNVFGSQKELAEALGVSPIKVTRVLNLLKLDQRIIDMIKQGKTKDLLALNLLNQIKNNDLQYSLFLGFLENGRDWLENEIKKIKLQNINNDFQNSSFIVKSNPRKGEFKIKIDTNKISKEKLEQLEKELKNILKNLI